MVSAMSSQFSIPDPQGIGEMPSFPDPRSPIFFEILCGLLLSSWPKASDEADGNTGRPQPGFFRMHRPGHFSLVIFPFSIPDPQGIGEMPSSPDPRSPIFFEILCGLPLSSWPKASDEKKFSNSPQMAWEGNFLVQILCGGSVIGYD